MFKLEKQLKMFCGLFTILGKIFFILIYEKMALPQGIWHLVSQSLDWISCIRSSSMCLEKAAL